MRFSVACNFDDALLPGLAPYPVREIYGKLTSDVLGGGRPSFYLPEVDRPRLERYVAATHAAGIEFNYLLNTSASDNLEFTRKGQRDLDELLEWIDGIGVDAVTVASISILRMVKRRHPRLRVRVSSHRFTDNPRKVRFWAEQGADMVVVSEVNIHREFAVLEALQRAADGQVELELIVNNWCRQDCAIAGNHAVSLSAGSRTGSKGFALDYCSLRCNHIRLTQPVSFLRANWIRPEDLHRYEALGYRDFKVVERNTPTSLLVLRTKAYAERRYDGNLLDLVQNYSYPVEAYPPGARGTYPLRRLLKHFVLPGAFNLFKLKKLLRYGKTASVLQPRRGPNPIVIDNRALDGFLDRFDKAGCQDLDCEACRYCHAWADKAVSIDPSWGPEMIAIYEDLLEEVDGGRFWEPHRTTLARAARSAARASRGTSETSGSPTRGRRS